MYPQLIDVTWKILIKNQLAKKKLIIPNVCKVAKYKSVNWHKYLER